MGQVDPHLLGYTCFSATFIGSHASRAWSSCISPAFSISPGGTPYDRPCREDIRGCRLPCTVGMVCRPKASAVVRDTVCSQDKPMMDIIRQVDPHLLGYTCFLFMGFVGVYTSVCVFMCFNVFLMCMLFVVFMSWEPQYGAA